MAKTDELIRLKKELADVREARTAVLRNGQAYKIAGSHETQLPDLARLSSEERRIKSEILHLIRPGPASTWAAF